MKYYLVHYSDGSQSVFAYKTVFSLRFIRSIILSALKDKDPSAIKVEEYLRCSE